MNNIYNKADTCAIIPFYNEVNSIKNIIDETLNYCEFIFAVNDGSTDGSENINYSKNSVQIISHTKNFGKGKALRTGFEAVLKANFNFIVTLDADLQHPPKYIPALVNKLKNYDVVIGNRLNDLSKMPFQRILSNKLTSFLLSKKTGLNILDSQSGFRAFNIKVIENILPECDGYEAESEMIVRAARNNLKLGFSPIPTIYGSENSKMKSFQAIRGFIKIFLM